VVTSIHRGKDGEVRRGIVKVVGLRDTATNRLGGVFVVAVDNGGRLDPLARATGLAASPSLCTSTATTSPLLWSYWLRWASVIATHLMCRLLPLIHPLLLHPLLRCLLTVHLAFIAWFGNLVTAIGILTTVAPGMVGDVLCRTLQELGPLWPRGNSL